MHRRHLLAGTAATLLGGLPGRAALGQGTSASARILKYVPSADLVALDPIISTAPVTRNHGFAVWDTLYGLSQDYAPEPQMAQRHNIDPDPKRITNRIREA
jgi:peptide/nickel transport system substrate-binding protein